MISKGKKISKSVFSFSISVWFSATVDDLSRVPDLYGTRWCSWPSFPLRFIDIHKTWCRVCLFMFLLLTVCLFQMAFSINESSFPNGEEFYIPRVLDFFRNITLHVVSFYLFIFRLNESHGICIKSITLKTNTCICIFILYL